MNRTFLFNEMNDFVKPNEQSSSLLEYSAMARNRTFKSILKKYLCTYWISEDYSIQEFWLVHVFLDFRASERNRACSYCRAQPKSSKQIFVQASAEPNDCVKPNAQNRVYSNFAMASNRTFKNLGGRSAERPYSWDLKAKEPILHTGCKESFEVCYCTLNLCFLLFNKINLICEGILNRQRRQYYRERS